MVEWETATGKIKNAKSFPTGKDIVAVAVDRTGSRVAAWSPDGVARVRDDNEMTWEHETSPPSDKYTTVAITPAAPHIVYAGDSRGEAIYSWAVEKNKRGANLECPWLPCPMLVSPDGRWLVACGVGVRVWDLTPDPPRWVELWKGHSGHFKAVAFTSDSRRLAVGGCVEDTPGGACVGGVWVFKP